MKVSILGCGWFGYALAQHLLTKGFIVKGSATTLQKVNQLHSTGIESYLIKISRDEALDEQSAFWDCDALIIASNIKLAGNTDYASGMQRVVEVISTRKIAKTIFISSTSVYGDADGEVDERTACKPESASGSMLVSLEALFKNAIGSQTTVLRFGGLVGPGRLPGSFFAGKKAIANGLAPINLIHLTDCIGLTETLLHFDPLPDYLNGVAPDHPSRAEFYTLAAKVQGLDIPEFVIEKLSWKIVNTTHQLALNYDWQVSNWKKWLASIADS